jgi:pimeloyl-ACP methyl ester carboxylesterase
MSNDGTGLPDYAVWGDAEWTVFLLHGGYGSKDYWIPEVKHLRRLGFRVIAWDTPGYGLSELPTQGAYTIESMAYSFIRLLKHAGSPGNKNILIGHSMGGLIAPLVTSLYPRRIAAQVISSTVESMGHTSEDYQANFIAERLGPLERGVSLKDSVPQLMTKMLGPTSTGEAVELVLKVTSETKDETFKAALKAIVAYDGREALKGCTVPTLCIAGELDPVGRPDMMEALAATVNGQYVCIPDVAHYGWAENPGAFNDAFFTFFQESVL